MRELEISGSTDSQTVNLLFVLFNSPRVLETVRGALVNDFAGDYGKVLAAARKAIGNRREGAFVLDASVSAVRNGVIVATGQGLFMPVQAEGRATILYRPEGGSGRR